MASAAKRPPSWPTQDGDDAVARDRRSSFVPTEATGMIVIGDDDFPIGNDDSKK